MPQLAFVTPAEYEKVMRRAPAILVPVGAVEWHDAHLPIGFDYLKAEALCQLIADSVGCFVAPPISFGYPFHFSRDPVRSVGTFCPDFDALSNYVLALGKMFIDKGFKVIYFLSGHYERSQIYMLKLITRRIENYAEEKGLKVKAFAHMEPDFTIRKGISQNAREDYVRKAQGIEYLNGDHAGFYETCLAMHLLPHLVREDKINPQYNDSDRGVRPCGEWGEKWTTMIIEKARQEIQAGLRGEDLFTAED